MDLVGQDGTSSQCTHKEQYKAAAQKHFSKTLPKDTLPPPVTPEDSSGGASEADDTVPLEDVTGSEIDWDTVMSGLLGLKIINS